jgi:hypothetical protein
LEAGGASLVDLDPHRFSEIAAEHLHSTVVEAPLERTSERLAVDHLEARAGLIGRSPR